jgi:hypothetical protein
VALPYRSLAESHYSGFFKTIPSTIRFLYKNEELGHVVFFLPLHNPELPLTPKDPPTVNYKLLVSRRRCRLIGMVSCTFQNIRSKTERANNLMFYYAEL